MTIKQPVVRTPHYVLMDGSRRLGPQVIPLDLGANCSIIYGFSDKGPYDRFCGNSDMALTPYPLVKGYLRNQVGDSGGDLNLVVLDADGPRERCLHAATMEAVLEAQESLTIHVTAAHRLTFDKDAAAYRVNEHTNFTKSPSA